MYEGLSLWLVFMCRPEFSFYFYSLQFDNSVALKAQGQNCSHILTKLPSAVKLKRNTHVDNIPLKRLIGWSNTESEITENK